MRTIIVALVLLLPMGICAQEESVLEQWEATLSYGIDSEVADLVDQISAHGTGRFDDSLASRFADTRSSELRIAILDYFSEKESSRLSAAARALVLSEEPIGDDLLRGCVTYLSRVVEDDSAELLERYREIARDQAVLIATIAIDAIGRHGSADVPDALIELYGDVESDDAKASVLRALGETGSNGVVEFLTNIAVDEYEISLFRQQAAMSLGKIGAAESQETLTELLNSEDSVLRAYVIQALGYYSNDEAATVLVDALRDSFWRVRVAALQGLGEQGDVAAVPAIAYKARRDPEAPVRQAAIATLGSIGGEEADRVLREIAVDVRTGEALRIQALEVLSESDLASSVDLLTEVAEAEWEREGSRLLDAVSRIVSRSEDPAVGPLIDRLFQHPNYIIRIYAIRAMGRNGLTTYEDELTAIADENTTGIMRTTALATLELLGIEYVPADQREEPDELPSDEPRQEPEEQLRDD